MLKCEQQNHDDHAQPKHDITARCGPQLAFLVNNISAALKRTQSRIAETRNVKQTMTATKLKASSRSLCFDLLPAYFKINPAASAGV